MIIIVIDALDTVTKGSVKGSVKGSEKFEMRTRVGTIQITALYRPEYREESWRLEETCGHSGSNERPSVNAGVENSQRSTEIIISKILCQYYS